MVGFIKLSRFKEALQHEKQWSQLRVFTHELLDEVHAVDPVLSIERNVDVDAGLLICQLYDRALS